MIDFFAMIENACGMVMEYPEYIVFVFIGLFALILCFAFK